jgi:hypothetical protein
MSGLSGFPRGRPQDQQDVIDERAAIMEVDGKLPREQAQAEAARLAQ